MEKWILTKQGLFNVRFIERIQAVEDYEDHRIVFFTVGEENYLFDYESSAEKNKAFGRLIDFLSYKAEVIHEL